VPAPAAKTITAAGPVVGAPVLFTTPVY
jgi:hypothetical protein